MIQKMAAGKPRKKLLRILGGRSGPLIVVNHCDLHPGCFFESAVLNPMHGVDSHRHFLLAFQRTLAVVEEGSLIPIRIVFLTRGFFVTVCSETTAPRQETGD